MRTAIITVGVSFFCSITAIAAEAKSDLSVPKCVERCEDYHNCKVNPNPMDCKWSCHKLCAQAFPQK